MEKILLNGNNVCMVSSNLGMIVDGAEKFDSLFLAVKDRRLELEGRTTLKDQGKKACFDRFGTSALGARAMSRFDTVQREASSIT